MTESQAARKQRFTVAITLLVLGVLAIAAAVTLHLTQELRVSFGELTASGAYELGIRSGARVALSAVVGVGLIGIGTSGIGGAHPLRLIRQALAISVSVAFVAGAMGMWTVLLGAVVATLVGVWFQRRFAAARSRARAEQLSNA